MELTERKKIKSYIQQKSKVIIINSRTPSGCSGTQGIQGIKGNRTTIPFCFAGLLENNIPFTIGFSGSRGEPVGSGVPSIPGALYFRIPHSGFLTNLHASFHSLATSSIGEPVTITIFVAPTTGDPGTNVPIFTGTPLLVILFPVSGQFGLFASDQALSNIAVRAGDYIALLATPPTSVIGFQTTISAGVELLE